MSFRLFNPCSPCCGKIEDEIIECYGIPLPEKMCVEVTAIITIPVGVSSSTDYDCGVVGRTSLVYSNVTKDWRGHLDMCLENAYGFSVYYGMLVSDLILRCGTAPNTLEFIRTSVGFIHSSPTVYNRTLNRDFSSTYACEYPGTLSPGTYAGYYNIQGEFKACVYDLAYYTDPAFNPPIGTKLKFMLTIDDEDHICLLPPQPPDFDYTIVPGICGTEQTVRLYSSSDNIGLGVGSTQEASAGGGNVRWYQNCDWRGYESGYFNVLNNFYVNFTVDLSFDTEYAWWKLSSTPDSGYSFFVNFKCDINDYNQYLFNRFYFDSSNKAVWINGTPATTSSYITVVPKCLLQSQCTSFPRKVNITIESNCPVLDGISQDAYVKPYALPFFPYNSDVMSAYICAEIATGVIFDATYNLGSRARGNTIENSFSLLSARAMRRGESLVPYCNSRGIFSTVAVDAFGSSSDTVSYNCRGEGVPFSAESPTMDRVDTINSATGFPYPSALFTYCPFDEENPLWIKGYITEVN